MLAERQHPFLAAGDIAREHDVLVQVYAARDYTPLWIDGSRATPQAIGLLHALRTAHARGLQDEDYEAGAITAPADELRSSAAQAQFDLALSVSAVRFLSDLHFGRATPQAAGFHLEVPPTRLDLAETLVQLASSASVKATLDGIEPPFAHYRLLRDALARYRELALDANLHRLPPFEQRSLKPGDSYAGAAQLRRLLAALGDLPEEQASVADPLLGPELAGAIGRFQRRHGLAMDGIIGRRTFAELTRPLAARVRQIELTLERWRWLPHFDTPPIVVNIPQFRLFAFHTRVDREDDIVGMDVIVGQSFPRSRTPVFTEEIRQVVFRPYWDVPYSITVREMLPAIRRNPAYFERNSLEIVRGAGDDAVPVPAAPENIVALATGSLRLRQRPGPDNSLGLVKFVLPNAFNVYLHATPAHELFDQSRRAFSHGCIRVRDPVALAEHVFHDQPEPWSRERIELAMQAGPDSQRVTLARPVRVFVVYGTAVATETGRILFFDDIYGHDRRLEALLGLEPVG
ncbi:MAG TPA: L,D-transpeptidase family protein [Steroidobacteraceae bacterium]|nr:L,D-transpeptidase family protein [Steroidobacteraceae bacterium]